MLGVSGRWSFRSDTLRLTLAVTGDESGFSEGLECDFFSPGASLPLLPRSFLPPSFRMPMYVSYRVCWRGNQRTVVNTLFTNARVQPTRRINYPERTPGCWRLDFIPRSGQQPQGTDGFTRLDEKWRQSFSSSLLCLLKGRRLGVTGCQMEESCFLNTQLQEGCKWEEL